MRLRPGRRFLCASEQTQRLRGGSCGGQVHLRERRRGLFGGKGITVASLGRLLKSRGISVSVLKLDPYLNVDPGTMTPYQHGEVFVTDDGAETDLDLGHYERFIDANLTRGSQRYDRPGLLGGHRPRAARRLPGRHDPGCPHITNEIKERIAGSPSRPAPRS